MQKESLHSLKFPSKHSGAVKMVYLWKLVIFAEMMGCYENLLELIQRETNVLKMFQLQFASTALVGQNCAVQIAQPINIT